MNRTSRFAATALAALLAGAPVAVFAQSNPTGTAAPGGTAAGSTTSGSSTAQPGTEANPAAPNPSMSGQSRNTGAESQQLSQSTLEDVQQQLRHQGFYRKGKIDGRWGPGTRQAVLSFQHSKGLHATGQLDQQTLDALGVHAGGG